MNSRVVVQVDRGVATVRLDWPPLNAFDSTMRKKLAAAADGKHHIETVWGRGYVLRDPQEAQVAA